MSNVLKRIGFGVLAVAVLALASPALAGPPHRFVVFGDSLSDPGNAFVLLRDVEVPPFDSLIPDAPYARGALHFSNGPTWVEQLSLLDRSLPSAGPALFIPLVFSNYAVGGARDQPSHRAGGAFFDSRQPAHPARGRRAPIPRAERPGHRARAGGPASRSGRARRGYFPLRPVQRRAGSDPAGPGIRPRRGDRACRRVPNAE